jgi:hypothetical protein
VGSSGLPPKVVVVQLKAGNLSGDGFEQGTPAFGQAKAQYADRHHGRIRGGFEAGDLGQPVDCGQYLSGVREEALAGRGQLNSPAGPPEELTAHLALKLLDSAAERLR